MTEKDSLDEDGHVPLACDLLDARASLANLQALLYSIESVHVLAKLEDDYSGNADTASGLLDSIAGELDDLWLTLWSAGQSTARVFKIKSPVRR